jgi:DNA-binding transcriptional MerR regulator
MAEAAEAVLAIPDKRAAKLARITIRQLRYWERKGLIVPSIRQEISPRNIVRLYTYQDLLGLLVAAELRNRVSLQHIRRLVAYLRDRGFAEPLRELRFATHGNDIYVQYPDGSWSGDPLPEQVIFHQVITLDALRARIPEATRRDEKAKGKVVRRRGVLGSKPIFAGTRILVATVERYLQAGYDTKEIIEEYPSLTPADIETARSRLPDKDGRIARPNYQRGASV